MKRKYFTVIMLIAVFVASVLVGCRTQNSFKPYEEYTGKTFDLVLDSGISIDGNLDEEIWTENKTAVEIPGAMYMEGKNEPVDVEAYGERSAKVYSYIGEKAIYFAFEVKDKNLYYYTGPEQLVSHQTRVEFYFSSADRASISRDAYYVGVNVTDDEEKGNVLVKQYNYSPYSNNWAPLKNMKRVVAKAKVDGEVMTDKNDTSYTPENNVGYVVECAIDISALAGSRDAMQFTGAFVQASGFITKRLNNSFVPGTSFLNVGSWKLMSNDGLIADKEAYFDSRVKPDEGVSIDGKLDDGIWENAVGRTVETTKYKNSDGGNKRLTAYVVTTEKGLYIGMDSNDEKVYYHDGMRAVYSTGAEILISTNKSSVIERGTALQWRYNVGGKGNRYFGYEIKPQDPNWETGLPWKEEFFAGLSAGAVKCDSPENGMNSGSSDGWTGEIFIPWTSFADTGIDYREQVAIMICPYSAYPLGTLYNGNQKYDYLAPVGVKTYGVGSQAINPQEKWFLFKDGKPLYDALSVDNCFLDKMNLEGGYYVGRIEAGLRDDVVTAGGFAEIFEGTSGGEFDFGDAAVTVIDDSDGSYTLKIPVSEADKFNSVKSIPFTVNGRTASTNVYIDTEILLDGVLDENIWESLNKLNTTQTATFTVSTEFTVALRDGAMYVGAAVSDPNFASYYSSSPIGMELYFNFGEKLSSQNTYQLRILANDESGAKFYVYSDVDIGSDKFSWTGGGIDTSVSHVFRALSGGYEMEAKIPYSVFGLSEKPEKVEIAVFTKFIKNTSDKITACKFFGFEGNKWSREQSIYLAFDESGFAPDKVYMQDARNSVVDAVNLIRGVNVTGGKYCGSISLSVTQGNMTVTDASFGDFDGYFDKSNAASGKYTFSLPTSLFEGNDSIHIPVTCAVYPLNAQITVNCNELVSFYAISDKGKDSIELWPADVVKKSGVDYYELKLSLYGDEQLVLPIAGDDVLASFSLSDGTAISAALESGNTYVLHVPVDALTVGEAYRITATAGEVTGSVPIAANKLSDADADTLKSNTAVMLGFDGNLKNGVSGKPDATMRRGKELITDGVYTANQSQRAMQVAGVTLGDEFTVSVLINGADVKKTYNLHYANVLLTTGNVDGRRGYTTNSTVPFIIGMRSDKVYLRSGINTNQIVFSGAMPKISDGFERWTFTVKRSSVDGSTDRIDGKMYIDGTLVAEGFITISAGTNFNNVDSVIGIGAPATYDDMDNPSKYVADSNDTVARHDIRMDNFVLYNGIMPTEIMKAIDGYYNQF